MSQSVDTLLRRRRFIDAAAQDADDLTGYLPRLRNMLADTGGQRDDGSAHRKISGSPAPWNPLVAELLGDIHAGARELADTLAIAVGHNPRRYGTGYDGTAEALGATAELAALLHGRDSERRLPSHAASQLAKWATHARAILDELRADEQPWTRAPEPLRCPNPQADDTVCDRPLWLAPGWAFQTDPPVYCRHCRDDDGRPYSWPHAAWAMTVQLSA